MTDTELTDRLREAIVLDGPAVWQTNGYLQDAQQAGLSLADALKRANTVSQEVANNSLLFQNIQARIARLAQPSRSQFIDQDLHQIINAASSLNLSPDFVRNQWVPTVLQRLTPKSMPEVAESAPAPVEPVLPPVAQAEPVVPEPEPVPVVIRPDLLETLVSSKPEPPTPEVQEAKAQLPDSFVLPVAPKVVKPTIPEPAPVVHSFTATPARVYKGQPVTLEWNVEHLLAVTIDDLGEGLSPKNRGWVKPTKSTDYTLFDANNNPLSTVRVDVIPRDRSGVYGVLFALVLLAIIYWFIRSSNARNTDPVPRSRSEQTSQVIPEEPTPDVATDTRPTSDSAVVATDTPLETSGSATVASSDNRSRKEDSATDETTGAVSSADPVASAPTPADARQGKYAEAFGDKPYDKAELGADERGWRRARSKGRWGYVNEVDEWVIKPEFDAVTPFRNNTASAFLNGQLITIDRNGEQVRN